jgi:hypothetical protein
MNKNCQIYQMIHKTILVVYRYNCDNLEKISIKKI